jgi:polyhydroxyalkanoate synthesis regulator phasin
MADDLIRHGQLDSGERDSVVELLMERGRRDEQSLRSYVREQVARAVRAVPVATRDDLRQLEERLRLEMTALRKAGPGGEG